MASGVGGANRTHVVTAAGRIELVEVLGALARTVSEQEFRQLSRDVPAMQTVCAIELPYSGT